ncbi:hypothetical protein H4582DRAFT_797612 [Lactarius indigo]|nr:hypothetical protein H4582DRAFT_797612 [Lactarius indigo]
MIKGGMPVKMPCVPTLAPKLQVLVKFASVRFCVLCTLLTGVYGQICLGFFKCRCPAEPRIVAGTREKGSGQSSRTSTRPDSRGGDDCGRGRRYHLRHIQFIQ